MMGRPKPLLVTAQVAPQGEQHALLPSGLPESAGCWVWENTFQPEVPRCLAPGLDKPVRDGCSPGHQGVTLMKHW